MLLLAVCLLLASPALGAEPLCEIVFPQVVPAAVPVLGAGYHIYRRDTLTTAFRWQATVSATDLLVRVPCGPPTSTWWVMGCAAPCKPPASRLTVNQVITQFRAILTSPLQAAPPAAESAPRDEPHDEEESPQ